jgi:peptidyl-prolyl cis-trans isomerase C
MGKGLKSRFYVALLVSVLGSAALHAANEGDAVLIQRDGVTVTRADFLQLLDYAVPQEKRASVLADEKKVREMIADVFVIRTLATEARAKGLDKDPSVRFQIAMQSDQRLMKAALDAAVAQQSEPDFEKLAREKYVANPEQFTQPARVRASHILVSVGAERGRDEALKRAQEARRRAVEGKTPFEELALEFSDDPSVKTNAGDLGYFERGKMVKPFDEAAFALTEPGQVSEVVETQFGFHVIKLGERKPEHKLGYDEVKAELISREREKFQAALRKQKVEETRSLEGIEVNQAAVSALVQAAPR